MKKMTSALLMILLVFAAVCRAETDASAAAFQAADAAQGGHILIAYFSAMETDGVDTVASASRVAKDGALLSNNQYIAQIIRRETDGELFAIETVQDYPGTHAPLLAFGHDEQAAGTKPELATHIEDVDRYDVVYLGFPIWNADFPMPIYSFLDEYDFSGKTIVPFTTHGGSDFAGTIETIAELEPNATVIRSGLSVYRSDVPNADEAVVRWLNGLNLE